MWQTRPLKHRSRPQKSIMIKSRRLSFVYPGSLDRPTGGYRYDRRMMNELERLGWAVSRVALSDEFPLCGGLARLDAEARFRALPDQEIVVCDGLAFGVIPEIAREHQQRLKLVALVHHPLYLEDGLSSDVAEAFFQREKEALQYTRRVITTSSATLAQVRDTFDVPTSALRAILPGTDPLPRPDPPELRSEPPSLLCVGSLIPRKGQDVLVEALSGLTDLDWQLDLVGDTRCDEAFAQRLQDLIAEHHLEQRVTVHGSVADHELSRFYDRASIFVLASHYEGYGMAFAEALLSGLPIVASGRGAVRNTVPAAAALFCSEGQAASFRQALKLMLVDTRLRAEKAQGAAAAGSALPTWSEQGALLSNTLEALL